jgi:oligopeptide transport system ATP-binding protein
MSQIKGTDKGTDKEFNSKALLVVNDLAVEFATYGGTVKAVRGVTLSLAKGEVLAVVGESGSGKSVTFQSLMGLIPMPPGKITRGEASLDGFDLIRSTDAQMQKIRGKEISMIFQDPLSSLNPTMAIGNQIAEVLTQHRNMSKSESRGVVLDLMKKVQIPEAESRINAYPHQFSGGMRQRVMIAMALACRPKVLVADEPTTALDVTIQGQIIELMRELRKDFGMAIVLITHDLGVVASLADRVAVMYAGEIVETGNSLSVFKNPKHPYTIGLKASIPNPLRPDAADLKAIPGSPPDMFSPPKGCAFAARCPHAMKICLEENPPVVNTGSSQNLDSGSLHQSKCWLNVMETQHQGSGR